MDGGGKGGERNEQVHQWLLEEDQPAVRHRTLVDLLDRREDDPEVRAARSAIGRVGWAAEQLRQQNPKGFWEAREPRNVGSGWICSTSRRSSRRTGRPWSYRTSASTPRTPVSVG